MPIGKNEEDALEHVIEKAYAEFAPGELDDAVDVKQVVSRYPYKESVLV